MKISSPLSHFRPGSFKNRINLSVAAASLMLGASVSGAPAGKGYRVSSPDGQIRVSIQMPAPSSPVKPRWSATFHGKQILTDCGLGLKTGDKGDLMAGTRVIRERERSVNQRVQVLFGKSGSAQDRFHEIRFTLETPEHCRTDIIFRCYDDAIALRYELSADPKANSVTITDETTSFRVEGEPTAYAQYLENYKTSHEHNVTPTPYRELPPGTLLDLPLTFSWTDGTYVAITEASLRHYAGMALMRPLDAAPADGLVCKLTPQPDGTKVTRPLPMQTPWRVVMVGDRPGALLESETLYCLNDPSVIKDVSWIKPGKITFSWWNGDVFEGQPGLPILSIDMAKKYIDFCAQNGIPTHSLTSKEGTTIYPWYHQSKPGVEPGPDTDVTRPRADFDLAAIRRYAESKHVRLWTWVHQAALRGRVEEAFAAFEKLGWSGMMVDFFDHDDQNSVEFAELNLPLSFLGKGRYTAEVWKDAPEAASEPNLLTIETINLSSRDHLQVRFALDGGFVAVLTLANK